MSQAYFWPCFCHKTVCNPLTSAVSPGRCHPWGVEGLRRHGKHSGWGAHFHLHFQSHPGPTPQGPGEDQEMEAQAVLAHHREGLALDVLGLGLLLPESETVSTAGGKQNRFSGDGRLNPVTSVWVQPLESPIPLHVQGWMDGQTDFLFSFFKEKGKDQTPEQYFISHSFQAVIVLIRTWNARWWFSQGLLCGRGHWFCPLLGFPPCFSGTVQIHP